MRWSNFLFPVMIVAAATGLLAQAPTYNLGRTPSEEEIRAEDYSVGPAGTELPPGKGTAKEGAAIYARLCVPCHGPTGAEGPRTRLVGKDRHKHPFTTVIWDFIKAAMPLNQGGSLSADETYALTAFILYKNGIIREDAVMDAKSLPRVRMPDRDPHLDRLAPPAEDAKP